MAATGPASQQCARQKKGWGQQHSSLLSGKPEKSLAGTVSVATSGYKGDLENVWLFQALELGGSEEGSRPGHQCGQGLPLLGTLTLLKPLPSTSLPASCRDQAQLPPLLPGGLHSVLPPPSISHMIARELFLNCCSGKSCGRSSQGKVLLCHSRPYWALPLRLVCPHPSHFLSQPFWPRGLNCYLSLETCISPSFARLRHFSLLPLCGGLHTHVGLLQSPGRVPALCLSPIWQFLWEGGNPSLAWPRKCVWG